jgi:nicotinamidase-related amidase
MRPRLLCGVLFASLFASVGLLRAGEPTADRALVLHLRSRVESPKGSGKFEVAGKDVRWDGQKTAIVICDMWDKHWCQGASARVAEMAPRMNDLIVAARKKGVFIIHCPSGTMAAYKDTPQRKLAQAAPVATPKVPLKGWCNLDRSHEPPLPIDDSDGGCDDEPRCPSGSPWRREIDILKIEPGDAITDSAEAYNLMQQRGIDNLLIMGVHLNMCVLGRPFGIRQMVYQGKNVVLVRDMTDTMYNSRRPPNVPHFRGTDLMVEHVEKHWCPTVTSCDFLGGEPFRFKGDKTQEGQGEATAADWRDVIDRAIRAHGGEAKLARLLKGRVKLETRLFLGQKEQVMAEIVTFHSPGRLRREISWETNGRTLTDVLVVNQRRRWMLPTGEENAIELPEENPEVAGPYCYTALAGLPNIRSAGVSTSRVPDERLGGRAVNCLRLERDDRWLQTYYFDKENGRLVKTSHPGGNAIYGPGNCDVSYSDFRDFDGLVLSTRMTFYMAGEKTSEIRVSRIDFLQEVPPETFEKPRRVRAGS